MDADHPETGSFLHADSQIATVAAIGVLMTLVAFDNVTDPKINFGFVQHVLSMDTLSPTTTISYRSITNPTLHDAAFALIVAAEAATAHHAR